MSLFFWVFNFVHQVLSFLVFDDQPAKWFFLSFLTVSVFFYLLLFLYVYVDRIIGILFLYMFAFCTHVLKHES